MHCQYVNCNLQVLSQRKHNNPTLILYCVNILSRFYVCKGNELKALNSFGKFGVLVRDGLYRGGARVFAHGGGGGAKLPKVSLLLREP